MLATVVEFSDPAVTVPEEELHVLPRTEQWGILLGSQRIGDDGGYYR